MSAFLYGVFLQWWLDIRSKSLLITCYIVPLLFFALMGGIFTSVTPDAKYTLIQSMTVMGVSMGAFCGLPPALVEVYSGDIKKAYKANGVPIYMGLVTSLISSFIHLMIMCVIIYITAPLAFNASLPKNPLIFFAALAIFVAVTLSIGSVLGLAVKNQSKLLMLSQLVFLPSIMLSGIMFPADMLPKFLELAGKIFPSAWGYKLMQDGGLSLGNLLPLAVILIIATALCCALMIKHKKD